MKAIRSINEADVPRVIPLLKEMGFDCQVIQHPGMIDTQLEYSTTPERVFESVLKMVRGQEAKLIDGNFQNYKRSA